MRFLHSFFLLKEPILVRALKKSGFGVPGEKKSPGGPQPAGAKNGFHIFSGALTPMTVSAVLITLRTASQSTRRASRTSGSASRIRQAL